MASDATQQSSALAPNLVLPPGSAEPEHLEFHDSSDDESNDGEENQEQTDAGVYKSAMALQGFLEFKCPNTCTYGKSCFQKVTLHDVGKLRKEFWGVDVLSRKKRREQVIAHLRRAHRRVTQTFEFYVPSVLSPWNPIPVCEIAYLVMINFFSGHIVSQRIRAKEVWIEIKREMTGTPTIHVPKPKIAPAENAARAWLIGYSKFAAEHLPSTASTKINERSLTVPYTDAPEFFKHYAAEVGENFACSDKTFYKALNKFNRGELKIRFKAAKTAFAACNTCAKLAVLMKKYQSSAFMGIAGTLENVDLLYKYLKLHNDQQMDERTLALADKAEAARLIS